MDDVQEVVDEFLRPGKSMYARVVGCVDNAVSQGWCKARA